MLDLPCNEIDEPISSAVATSASATNHAPSLVGSNRRATFEVRARARASVRAETP